MNKAANSYWADARLVSQRPAARALALESPVYDFSRAAASASAVAAPRAEARHRGRVAVPSWAMFSMIILATFAMCVTVTMRTHAGMRSAETRHERMSAEVERLRDTNAAIEREVERLRTDPRTIETAARTKLSMVRANEIVVPVE